MKSHHTVVVLADACHARIFTLENRKRQGGIAGPALIERADLVNPGRRQRAAEQLSDTRPGSHRAPAGPGHTVDDHRDAKFDEVDRKFASDIVSATTGIVSEDASRRLLYVAGPSMIGNLRKQVDANIGPVPEFVDRDVAKLTTAEALQYLQKQELV